MPTKGVSKLDRKAKRQGLTVPELCQNTLVKEGTLHKAAVALGVYDGTIRYHVRKLGENGGVEASNRTRRAIADHLLLELLAEMDRRNKAQPETATESTGD